MAAFRVPLRVGVRLEYDDMALRRLDRPAQQQVAATIELQADEPRPPKLKALVGRGGYLRVQTGDYCIVDVVSDDVLLVLVVALGHRRDLYER